ncbi:hypothetical protein BpHYR1_027686, partial [Brachionus plicatilis]
YFYYIGNKIYFFFFYFISERLNLSLSLNERKTALVIQSSEEKLESFGTSIILLLRRAAEYALAAKVIHTGLHKSHKVRLGLEKNFYKKKQMSLLIKYKKKIDQLFMSDSVAPFTMDTSDKVKNSCGVNTFDDRIF